MADAATPTLDPQPVAARSAVPHLGAAPRPGAGRRAAARRGTGGRRTAVAAAVVLLASATLLSAAHVHRAGDASARDARAVAAAGDGGRLAIEAARLASMAAADPVHGDSHLAALRTLVERIERDAADAAAALRARPRLVVDGGAALALAQGAADAARGRLLRSADRWLAEAPAAAADDPPTPTRSAPLATLRELQIDATIAADAATRWREALQASAARGAEARTRQSLIGHGALLAALLLAGGAMATGRRAGLRRNAIGAGDAGTPSHMPSARGTSAARRSSGAAHAAAATSRSTDRGGIARRIDRAIAHAKRHPGYGYAVLLVRFDRIEQIDGAFGAGASDDLLRQIDHRLQVALRPGDAIARVDAERGVGLRLDGSVGGAPGAAVIAARIGGDEFAVVLDGVADADTVAAIADRLLAELAEPYLVAAAPVQAAACAGIVLGRGTEAGADAVLRDAGTALVEARRTGRGRWVLFDGSMHERLVRALSIEADLRLALQRDELFVMYQPVVDLATRRPLGVEALVRWRHPQRGLVPPVDFIPIAEEAGLIDAVGSFVLATACRQFARWQSDFGASAPRRLAVNLSRAQLQRGALVDEVAHLLAETRLPPGTLQLEITETLAAADEVVQATLRRLKALGVTLALDDFGTGYSSLACLHQLPIDTVKIDRSFVSHAEGVEYHRVLIEATIRVADALGMTTVAEGIETEGQASLMHQLGCHLGQGYLYSRPLTADDCADWLRRSAAAAAATVPVAGPEAVLAL